MVYDTFLNTVKEQMEQALGDGYSLTLRKVQKNNGLILDGLCIAKGNGTIAPSIYLNSCYEQYLNGLQGRRSSRSCSQLTTKAAGLPFLTSWSCLTMTLSVPTLLSV